MNYSVGSVADLISGKNTPNKPKIIKKEYSKPTISAPSDNENEGNESLKVDSKEQQNRKIKKKKRKLQNNDDDEGSRKKTLSSKRISKEENGDVEKDDDDDDNSKSKKIRSEEQESKTIFVGNVPLTVSKLKLRKLFGKFGEIESVRLRCAAPDDPNVSKKVAIIKKKFHPDRKSLHCFIRFQNKDDAIKALGLNGFKYKSHHLRVNMAQNTEKPDENKALFVGNIPFDAEEEDLWKLFEPCGEIDSVRLVRDPRTSIGKGFGYINFKSADSVELALEMAEFKLKNRELRVKRSNLAASKNANSKKKKKPRKRSQNSENSTAEENENNQSEEKKPKKLKSVAVKNTIFQGVTAMKKKKKKLDKASLRKKVISKLLTSKTKKKENKNKEKQSKPEKENDPYTLKIFY